MNRGLTLGIPSGHMRPTSGVELKSDSWLTKIGKKIGLLPDLTKAKATSKLNNDHYGNRLDTTSTQAMRAIYKGLVDPASQSGGNDKALLAALEIATLANIG